ncbi:MAG: aldehyde dehydrogenase family protein [Rhodospirillaceae bacterium]
MTDTGLLKRDRSLFIAGAWRSPVNGEPIGVIDPSTGAVLAALHGAGPADVDAAVGAAVGAFPAWSKLKGAERARFLRDIADRLMGRREVIIDLLMLNNGKPRREAEIDASDAVATFAYYGDLAEQLDKRQNTRVALPDPAHSGKTRYEPIGPVGMIVPWNFPMVTSAWKVAPALAAGCTVVIKTSSFTPLVEMIYGDIAAEIGLPAGVLNILTGGGSTGAALTADSRLRKLSFTGSNTVGTKVMTAAARHCVPVALELGGKSPIVVMGDAPVEEAVDLIMGGIFFNAGQMCSATSRLVVDRRIAEPVLARLVEKTKALKVDSPYVEGTDMGPMTTENQFRAVQKTFERAKADGLNCLAGGYALNREGFFVAPTIYDDVPVDNPVWREEIFGPVLAVRRFDTEAEAIALANDTEYGLAATVVGSDMGAAERLAQSIEAGHIWVNTPQVPYVQSAWGGFKASGIGRELGPWGMDAFLGVKHITTPAK